ncbi:hypothetical protein PV11_09181 [Exophiala sideris]|uniref:Probable aspartic-type endopeptidase OPSB n=1 Tax=Exophiala sideris TaxID=1016849 RepID=A0A0D1YQZ5_9EURO|nr:hypothetical protein PV11_09181 [Exophiala sideris]
MKYSATLVALAAVTTPLASALTLAPRSSSPRVIGLPIQRRNVPDVLVNHRSRLRRRAGTVSQTLDNEESLYYANLTLGTPAQPLRLHIDTGSSDLWVNTANSTFCEAKDDNCEGGTYSISSSSTYKYVNSEFNISYVDGTSAVGDYVTDTLGFGGETLDNFQFGIGESSTSSQGVLGIGYASEEVAVNRAGLQPYSNLPVALVDAGLIASNAYSLWLNDLDSSEGQILFGGVDTAKYSGDLATVPIIEIYGGYYELLIALTSVAIPDQNLSSSSSLPAAVLLDSGSTLTYLPNDITETIFTKLGAVYESNLGAAYVECSKNSDSLTIDFDFSGQTISVPYDELFLDAGTNSQGQPLTFDNGETACLFGIAPADDSTAVLGDTFLRSAYVVYDLANNAISLAQTVFNATSNDIQEISKGTNGVPGATAVSNPVTTVAAGSDGARLGGSTATVTGSINAASMGKNVPPVSLLGAIVAIAVAVFAG